VIARLTGTIVEETLDHIVLDVRGVGYLVHVPIGTSARARTTPNGEVVLIVHTVVREDAFMLFGFASDLERDMFLKMIAVSGIGPKLGIAILSDMSVEQLVRAIRTDDLTRLTKVPGIGKKTAQRILLELKSAVEGFQLLPDTTRPTTLPSGGVEDDLRSALLNLGYKPNVVDDTVAKMLPLPEDLSSIEPLLRKALQLLK
jgi:Holliday junction DNA helicase RuvA